VDRVADASLLHVLEKHHPRSVAVSAARGIGLDRLQDAVIEMLSADFTNVAVDVPAANGKVIAYLQAHAEVYRQEFHDNRVRMLCYLPKHLVHHIQEPDVKIDVLAANNGQTAVAGG
jgi:GTP-binding protein HflX